MRRPKNALTRVALVSRCCALTSCLAGPALVASEYSDLKRLEPVPANVQIPIVDFVRPALLMGVQLNHIGTQIGAIVPGNDDHTSLFTYNLKTQAIDGVSPPTGDKDISSFSWLDGSRLTYQTSTGKLGGGYLILSEAGKLSNAEPVAADTQADSMEVLANPPEDRTQFLVDLSGSGLRYDHLEMISAANHGSLVIRYPELKTDHGFDITFLADKMGKLAFGITQEDGVLSMSRLAGESWVKCPEDLDQVEVLDSGDNPGEIVALGPRDGAGPRPLEFMDAATGRPGDVILQDKGYDYDGWLFRDPQSHNIVGAIYDRAAPHVIWFTQGYRDLQKLVDGLFPNQIVRIQGMDDAGKTVLVTSGSDRQPVVYSWVDLEKHKGGLIKNSAPWIDPKRMQPMGVIKYATAEGRQMDAYITLPAGASKTNPPPLVVIPHAYAEGRWAWGFDSDVQFYASRGYAVLQPNYRGSAGYTWMFPEAESWDFRKMSDDVAAAAKKAIAMGLADPKRVAIIGTGFGGYLAAAGAAFEPGLYKCALSISGFYDYGRYIREDNYLKFTDPTYSRYLRKLGDPGKDPEKFNAMSPLHNSGQIHSALFIAWGEFDNPEMISQSKDMASAVQRNNVPLETISFLNEASGVRHLDHKIELYQHIEAFLSKNL